MMLSQADIALLKELKAAGERGRTSAVTLYCP